MHEMGIPESRWSEFDTLYDEYDTKICLGVHEDTLLPTFSHHFDLHLPPGFSMREYFLDHFDQNQALWSIAAQVNKTKRIGLLTDMYPGMLSELYSRKLIPPENTWEVVVDSSLIGYRKPMPEIYRIAEKRAGVPANEILFIDNRQKNLAPAKVRGWQTFFYDSRNYEKSTRDLAKFLGLSGE